MAQDNATSRDDIKMILTLYGLGAPLIVYGWRSRGPDGKRPGSGGMMLGMGIMCVVAATIWLIAVL